MFKSFGIDPGPNESALVVLNYDFSIDSYYYDNNSKIEAYLEILGNRKDHCAIEFLQSYGMAVGQSVFQTCRAVGRLEKAWERKHVKENLFLYTRPPIHAFVAGNKRSKVRTGLIEQLGSPKKGGPLAGISRHKWDALAVCFYHLRGYKLALAKECSMVELGWLSVR